MVHRKEVFGHFAEHFQAARRGEQKKKILSAVMRQEDYNWQYAGSEKIITASEWRLFIREY